MWHVPSPAAFWILSETLSFKIKEIHTSLTSCKEPVILVRFYET